MTNTNRHYEARKSCGNLNRILSIILAAILLTSVFTVFPLTVSAAEVDAAESGEREVVSLVRATSNLNSILNDVKIQKAYFYIQEGRMASIPNNMGSWFKLIDGQWHRVESGNFSDGEWQYAIQVRTDVTNYQIGEDTKVIIDGEEWEQSSGAPYVGDTYSYSIFYHQFTVKTSDELVFLNAFSNKIKKPVVGEAITPFSVASGVSGGTKPYTFSRFSGPGWLSVSADGVVSGTPDKANINSSTLTVLVIDQNGERADIRINVPPVAVTRDMREAIPVVRANSNLYKIPIDKKEIQKASFTITEGQPASIPNRMASWFKKVDGEWQRCTDGTFTPGEWMYSIQVRTDAAYSIIDNDTKVIIDGEEWETDGDSVIGDVFSYNIYYRVFMIEPSCTITFDPNGGTGTMKTEYIEKGNTYDLPECTFTPPEGKVFNKWAVNGSISFGNVTQITVNEDTVLEAQWKDAASGTYSISGTATSYLEETDNTIIILSKKSGDNYALQGTRTVSGNSGTYGFTGLSNGQYKLSVRKTNHVTREYNVTILLGSKTQDVTINPIGDVDGNGKVQAADAMKAYQHAQGKADAQLSDYAFDCADVAPVGEPNGKVQAADAMVIYQQAQGKHSLF